MDYNARSQSQRDDWYQNNKENGFEVFATTGLYGETVEFLVNPDGPLSESKSSNVAAALIPFPRGN